MKKINPSTKWTLLFVLFATIGSAFSLPSIQRSGNAQRQMIEETQERENFNQVTSFAYTKAFELYYEAKLNNDETVTMADVFIKDSDTLSDIEKDSFSTAVNNALSNNLNGNTMYYQNASILNSSMQYFVIDHDTNVTVSNSRGELTKSPLDKTSLSNIYSWYLVIDFDKAGKPTVNYEGSSNPVDTSMQAYYDAFNTTFSNSIQVSSNEETTSFIINDVTYAFKPITNTTFRFALHDISAILDSSYNYGTYYPDSYMMEMIFSFGAALSLATFLLALLQKKYLPYGFEPSENGEEVDMILIVGKKSFNKSYRGTLRDIPIEIMLLLDLIILGLSSSLGHLSYSTIPATFMLFVIYLCIAYNVWYYILLLKTRDFQKHSLSISIIKYLRKPVHNLYDFALHLDMSNQDTRRIVILVSLNLMFLIFCSIFHDFEVRFILLLLYSVTLYFILKTYIRNINKDYHSLLNVIRNIAVGKTNNHIEDDLGLFEPFKPELKDIQTNIETAIAEEVHSQQMKTELISNVSHDLKTPLTSLISYIDILKKDDITQEERRKYLDILDKSSDRLKHLVEDLFEVSKANSGNVSLDLMKVDVISLMKQVQVECADALKKRKLNIRNTFSDEKIILLLDSQKTYRIFENLISNISKYALKGTRVYIDIKDYDTFIEVSMKNISAQELNFDVEDITERFMRGDKSRNTEGSGLGLAIVKSFIELQNGTLKIQTDGDLFKVFIRFQKPENKSEEN